MFGSALGLRMFRDVRNHFAQQRIISRGGAVIIVQHAAQPLAALDRSMITIMGFIRDDQPVAETLVVSLEMIQVSNTTPIFGLVPIFETNS